MATVATQPFFRDSWADMYAKRHLESDPGIQQICYLTSNSPEREIRLVEVNDLLAVRETGSLEPIDFGVDIDGTHPHRLLVLDVTPKEWQQILANQLTLPPGWSLEGMKVYRPEQ